MRSLWIVVESLRPGAGGPRAARRRQRLQDWVGPLRIANDHLLAPAMYQSLALADCLHDLPADVRDYLGLLHKANRDRNALIAGQAAALFDGFAEAGVQAMIFKGGLSFFLDDDSSPAARMVQAIDLLVRPEDLEKAKAVLTSSGYYQVAADAAPQRPFVEYRRPNAPAPIGLHLEVIDAEWLLPSSMVWQRAEQIAWRGSALLVPSATDRLLHNFLDAQVRLDGGYYGGRVDLRQLYDFSRIAGCDEADIDWDEIFAMVGRHHLEAPLQSHIVTAHRLFGASWELPVPVTFGAQLRCWRSIARLTWPSLESITKPWGHIRYAFARHRMVALYGEGPLLVQQFRHLMQFLGTTRTGEWVRRLTAKAH